MSGDTQYATAALANEGRSWATVRCSFGTTSLKRAAKNSTSGMTRNMCLNARDSGLSRGRRYIKPLHSPEWFTMYEADDLSVVTSPAYLARSNAPTPATQRTLPIFPTRRVRFAASCTRWGEFRGTYPRPALECTWRAWRSAVQLRCARRLSPGDVVHRRDRLSPLRGGRRCELHPHGGIQHAHLRRTVVGCLVRNHDIDGGDRAKRLFEEGDLDRLGIAIRADAATYALEICRLSLPGKR